MDGSSTAAEASEEKKAGKGFRRVNRQLATRGGRGVSAKKRSVSKKFRPEPW